MALITKPYTFSNGTTANGTEVNSDFDTIFNDYNGNITDANIAASGITTYAKVNATAISNLANTAAAAGSLPIANIPYKDEDNMASDSATHVPTQQSVKAYAIAIPASSAEGDILYRNSTVWTRLAKGTALYNLRMNAGATAPEWSAPSAAGNCLFCFGSGHEFAADGGSSRGKVSSTSLVATTGTVMHYYMTQPADGAYLTIISSKWTKVASVSTATIHCWIWGSSAVDSLITTCKVNIGTTNGTVAGTVNTVTPEYKSFTIDVSGLTNTTVYDVTVQLTNNVNAKRSYLSHIIAYGS